MELIKQAETNEQLTATVESVCSMAETLFALCVLRRHKLFILRFDKFQHEADCMTNNQTEITSLA